MMASFMMKQIKNMFPIMKIRLELFLFVKFINTIFFFFIQNKYKKLLPIIIKKKLPIIILFQKYKNI